jgi:hypothetical protein
MSLHLMAVMVPGNYMVGIAACTVSLVESNSSTVYQLCHCKNCRTILVEFRRQSRVTAAATAAAAAVAAVAAGVGAGRSCLVPE